MQKYSLQRQGQGRRLRPDRTDAELLEAGHIEFTIDQQPYLQGFLPVLRAVHVQGVAGTLTGIAEANTGLKFLDKETVKPY